VTSAITDSATDTRATNVLDVPSAAHAMSGVGIKTATGSRPQIGSETSGVVLVNFPLKLSTRIIMFFSFR
jgi:hypothetical protein